MGLFGKILKTGHERMVAKAARKLEERGHDDVRANLKKYEKPRRVVSKLTGEVFMPDITSSRDGRFMIYSVVNRELLAKEGVDASWTLFEKFAHQNDATFYIVFPMNLVGEVRKRVEELAINPQFWEL